MGQDTDVSCLPSSTGAITRDEATARGACEGVDVVIHTAAALPLYAPEDIRTTPYPYTPIGIAVQADGTLLAAFGTACWQLDRSLRIIGEPGSVIGERGNAAFAYGVMVTPSGSIILKPGSGKEIYRLASSKNTPDEEIGWIGVKR